ncbi:hypothetical protein ACNTMW_27765 [Planosporangium sp. 12N6]|uniref:hypothetical protein n=1 Tax=Planosporangium spinosum TaxID=3402278 RepID=UPI003CF807FC
MSDEPKPPEPPHPPDNGIDATAGRTAGAAPGVRPDASPGVPSGAAADAPASPPAGASTADGEAAAPDQAKIGRGRVVGIVLVAVFAVAVLLCMGGLGVGYLFYRGVSEPDRSTPGVVVRQYLQATFDDRDKSKAARFTCEQPTDIGEIERTLAEIVSREQRFGIRITVGWEDFVSEENGNAATVRVRLKTMVPEQTGQSSESFRIWSFTLMHRSNGWRVCGAQPVG